MPFKKDICLFIVMSAILIALASFIKIKNKRTTTVSWRTMGTVAAITGEKSEDVKFAAEEAKKLYVQYNALLSSWDENSELSRISALAGKNKTSIISPIVTNAYKVAFTVMHQSNGAFNPLIGNVMKLWGFNGADRAFHRPSEKEISSLPFSPDDVCFNGSMIRLEKKGMSLDLGGVAKGEAIDALTTKLATHIPDIEIMIDLGGNIKTLGPEPRRIGIRNPFGDGYVATVVLTNGEAVATSGDYERFTEINGIRYSHIFDGRTGAPATNNVASTTVIARSAATADALSTTLYVLGPTEGIEFIRNFYPDVAALWISTSNTWTTSDLMKHRIQK